MKTIGYLSRSSFFPTPVVLIANDEGKFWGLFPNGDVHEIVTGNQCIEQRERFHSFSNAIELDPRCEWSGFAFGVDDVFIGTRNQVLSAIRARFAVEKDPEVQKMLSEFLINAIFDQE